MHALMKLYSRDPAAGQSGRRKLIADNACNKYVGGSFVSCCMYQAASKEELLLADKDAAQ